MNYENDLQNFANKYSLIYKKQEFLNCFNGNWIVQTYSLYNDFGCFTIHHLLQRNEIDFYISKAFSNDRKKLMERQINVYNYQWTYWNKRAKFLFFTNPFFFENIEKVIESLITVMELEIKDNGTIFGLMVSKKVN